MILATYLPSLLVTMYSEKGVERNPTTAKWLAFFTYSWICGTGNIYSYEEACSFLLSSYWDDSHTSFSPCLSILSIHASLYSLLASREGYSLLASREGVRLDPNNTTAKKSRYSYFSMLHRREVMLAGGHQYPGSAYIQLQFWWKFRFINFYALK